MSTDTQLTESVQIFGNHALVGRIMTIIQGCLETEFFRKLEGDSILGSCGNKARIFREEKCNTSPRGNHLRLTIIQRFQVRTP